MIDPNIFSQADRDLVVEFTNIFRDLDTAVRLAKQTTAVSRNTKHKLSKKFEAATDPLVHKSLRVLKQLEQSMNPELQQLAEQSISKNGGAIEELRRLGRRIKQDMAEPGKERTWSILTDPLNL